MNNFILINRCYSEYTPESSENGDFSDTGIIDENLEVSFSELVKLMKDHNESSNYPKQYTPYESYSTGFYTKDYRTYTDREETIHYSANNTANCAKYWKLARIFADHK